MYRSMISVGLIYVGPGANVSKSTMFKVDQSSLKEVHGSDVPEKKFSPPVCPEIDLPFRHYLIH